MATTVQVDDREVYGAVNDVINRVLDFDDDTRRRILRTVETFLLDSPLGSGAKPTNPSGSQAPSAALTTRATSFSTSESLSPKEFLLQKQPSTDQERVACLAYYLTHYRETPHFKTFDISLLNTEAAQVKFSNTAFSVANATNAGLLVPAGKGAKQLSAYGEQYVQALPDRAAAKEVLAGMRSRRARKRAARNGKEGGK